jgi:putative ATP-dependent endonuclease of OLD family
VANEWTLEYDLAYSGLEKQLHIAIALADYDDKINEKKVTFPEVCDAAGKSYDSLSEKGLTKEELCSRVYEPLAVSNPVSKPTTAQYLAELLEDAVNTGELTAEDLRKLLPPYVLDALVHVTEPFSASGSATTIRPEKPEPSAPMASASDGAEVASA